MAAKLVGIRGLLDGVVCPVDERATTLGRLPSNDLPLPIEGVADRHCVLKKTAGRFIIDDCDRRRPTLINNCPAAGQSLEHGDRVIIGNAAFVFLIDDQPISPSGIRVVIEDGPVQGSVLKLQREDVWEQCRKPVAHSQKRVKLTIWRRCSKLLAP